MIFSNHTENWPVFIQLKILERLQKSFTGISCVFTKYLTEERIYYIFGFEFGHNNHNNSRALVRFQNVVGKREKLQNVLRNRRNMQIRVLHDKFLRPRYTFSTRGNESRILVLKDKNRGKQTRLKNHSCLPVEIESNKLIG